MGGPDVAMGTSRERWLRTGERTQVTTEASDLDLVIRARERIAVEEARFCWIAP